MERVSVLIAEFGANWAAWTRKLDPGPGGLVIVAQTADESPQAFGRRVVQRLRGMRKESLEVAEAALVAGSDCSNAHRSARAKILRKLTALLAQSGNTSRLFLDPAATTDTPSYNYMRALAWALSDLAGSSRLSIRVEGAPSPASSPAV